MANHDTEQILITLKAWAAPIVGGLLLALLSSQVNTAVNEMKDTRLQMQQVLLDAKVSATRFEYMVERTKQLEDARKDANALHQQYEARLSGLEQQCAMFNQYIQAKK